MIVVTKLNGKPVVVNAELIKLIESTPDTLITLTSGDHFMVKEEVEEVVERDGHRPSSLPRSAAR